MRLHVTAMARMRPEGPRAVLLRGASGAGKSDLALRLMQRGWRLVGDDYVDVWPSGGALYAAGPERIVGLIEARGLGLVSAAFLPLARVALVVDCVQSAPDRLPELESETIQGIATRRLALCALEPSACAKLEAVLADPRRPVALGPEAALPY